MFRKRVGFRLSSQRAFESKTNFPFKCLDGMFKAYREVGQELEITKGGGMFRSSSNNFWALTESK